MSKVTVRNIYENTTRQVEPEVVIQWANDLLEKLDEEELELETFTLDDWEDACNFLASEGDIEVYEDELIVDFYPEDLPYLEARFIYEYDRDAGYE